MANEKKPILKCYCAGRNGFTLFECMITVFILLILIGLCMPTWRHFLSEHRRLLLLNQLTDAITLTRAAAIERGEVVKLCGSADLATCDGDWGLGMVMTTRVTGAPVLRQYSHLSSGYRLLWRSSLGHNVSLEFTAEGLPNGTDGSFYLCPLSGNRSLPYRVVVNRIGRLRIEHAPVYALCSFSS